MMIQQKLYSHEEMLNKVLGEKGTPERNQYEAELKSFLMGDAIKKARQSCNLTQVSRIEGGKNLTFSTIARAFKAMGIHANFEVKGVGKVALW